MKVHAIDEKIERVFLFWSQTFKKPRARLDEKRAKKIGGALRMGYSEADLMTAIDGCKASRWHMGENERHRQYINVELIFRDADHIDAFMARAPRAKPNEAQERSAAKPERHTAVSEAALKSLRLITNAKRAAS